MIRANNDKVDVESLRRRVTATVERLRSTGAVERARELRLDERARPLLRTLGNYRAAQGFLDRADDFTYPQTRLPGRLGRLHKFGKLPASVLLRAYNYAFRQSREARSAIIRACHELMQAGYTTTRRISELEADIEALREELKKLRP